MNAACDTFVCSEIANYSSVFNYPRRANRELIERAGCRKRITVGAELIPNGIGAEWITVYTELVVNAVRIKR